MVKVCDAIMGTGKSSAAITLLNEHKGGKYIYITPYLEEANRIKENCPDLKFVEPSNKIKDFNFKKGLHTAKLIKDGRNITTTHQAFKNYTQEMLDDITRQGYILIIDENVDVLEDSGIHSDDLDLLTVGGYVKEDNGVFTATGKRYEGDLLRDVFRLMTSRELLRFEGGNQKTVYYWTLPPSLIKSFKEVYILTYLFEGQSLHHLLKIYNIDYEMIGIEKTDDGYRFGDYPGYVPEYTKRIKDKIHIINNDKLNSIGDGKFSLSMNWYKKDGTGVDTLKKNVYNVFHNIWGDIPSEEKLWGGYSGEFKRMRGKGYTKSFLTFNARATNNYRDRTCLVYITNLFMNLGEKKLYEKFGLTVDEDLYALSIMVQWIWRSAIRDGEEVFIYIPSKRMRNLLIKWINGFNEGVKTDE